MQAVATWWGYAEGNRALVSAVVALIVIAAVAFVARRVVHSLRERR
jgi:hypothetical protein